MIKEVYLPEKFLGIDVGAETIKVVELTRLNATLSCTRRVLVEHGKQPAGVLAALLQEWDWGNLAGAGATGRLCRQLRLRHVPSQQAIAYGYRFFFPDSPATIVSIGSHGFCALELRPNGLQVFRENSRCSQGTGNFLRQLAERFSLSVEEASELSAEVINPAALSGRCPVILKTDMTHLANKGEGRPEILAGLFDALCENVLNLVKPGFSPSPVVLAGGVSRSRRVQRTFDRMLREKGIGLRLMADDGLFLEATGSAVLAAQNNWSVPALTDVMTSEEAVKLERGPALSHSLHKVRRMPRQPWAKPNGAACELILGFDIGSTGAKAVAIDAESADTVWEGYRQTQGAPVTAAQELTRSFLESDVGGHPVAVLGATGSGREIVGSLMTTCYQKDSVFVLNEIAAHAAGACHFEPLVDTIFEIGGQDAKYIRLEGGRVIDCAMNEACSAGTGSFIEEQGSKFADIRDVVHLGKEALLAESGISLGQHCSVFMAEIIDEAVAAGIEQRVIIAGLYDSIIQNYLNRVKGSRSVGRVIFCQGMPFAADALSAAVAKQTGSDVIVPPNPGTVGALGIALLARRELSWRGKRALDLRRFQNATVEQKTTFVCGSTVGCGGSGNKCRIDHLQTLVDGHRQSFTWGGVCSLHDKGTRKRKLPYLAPNPFQEREDCVRDLVAPLLVPRGKKRVVMSDEFMLKSLFPFFAGYVHALGFDVEQMTGSDKETLKRGLQEANVPFCAPMQLFHGLASRMNESDADYMILPVMRTTTHVSNEPCCQVCPVVQAAPDVLRQDLASAGKAVRLLTPEFLFGETDFKSAEFSASCRRLAESLGVADGSWRHAQLAGCTLQKRFEDRCRDIGLRALQYCAEKDIVPVVVLGRPYTIYNPILNSNVPALLLEQGAIAVPVDCYPTRDEVPLLRRMYWGYGQRILRAAQQVRDTPGQYAVYCSNYSCGPDSFNLHFFTYTMEGKPFAVIETDGHAGDAGTKTRLEAFLFCVEQDLRSKVQRASANQMARIEQKGVTFPEAKARGDTLLVPWMGPASEVSAAVLRGTGMKAEALAKPGRSSLQLGRRHTSGKECLPMCLTLGRLLERLECEPDRRFTYMMPQSNGPCRFGMYNMLDKIVLEKLGLGGRCEFLSPHCDGYFAGMPSGLPVMLVASLMASDYLFDALLDVRPAEKTPGAADEIYDRRHRELLASIEEHGRQNGMALQTAMREVVSGRLFGLRELLTRASAEFAAVRAERLMPTVLVVGEIYVRGDAFANDGVVEKLEGHGCRVRVSSMHEWILFVDYCNRKAGRTGWVDQLRKMIDGRVRNVLHGAITAHLSLTEEPYIMDVISASQAYLLDDVGGDSVLALGRSLCDWSRGEIDAVVNVGPTECMPTRIAESQLCHIAAREGMPTLTLSYNGDPFASSSLENFAFEVHSRYRQVCFLRDAQR